MRRLAVAALLAAVAMPAVAAPSDDLKRVMDEHWAWYLKNSPITATSVGLRDYDDQLGDFTLAALDRQAVEATQFARRVAAIPDAGLSPAELADKAILLRTLTEQAEAARFGERTMNISTLGSWFTFLPELSNLVPLRTKADYVSYTARIAQVPRVNDEQLAMAREAVKGGFVQPCATLTTVEKSITGAIAADPAQSRFYAPYARPKPFDMSEADWQAMQVRAKAIVTDGINPAWRKTADFFRTEYLPKCRKTVGIATLPDGARYYAFLVRQQTTTDLSPDAIHKIGLAEVKRIGAEMDALAKKAGYPSRAAFVQKLRTDPVYYAKSGPELMAAAALMAKDLDGKMPTLFGKLPRLPYGVRAIPAAQAEGSTTAYYMPGAPEAGIAGTFYVNLSKLDQRPLWELPALTAHEAVPGHHNQVALQQEMTISPYRQNAAFFTAFTEGWGLYSEHLGIGLGLYDTPEKDMGRLSYEMWRACRLVLDTGIHSKGWTKEQAVAFMKENSALTDANIDAEVNRYITNPGQALAYKLGELKFKELRAKAEQALGAKFDVRRFHDAALAQGSVPLDVLERQMDAWIASEKARG